MPTIHTNIWDAVIAVPTIMVITEIIKWFTKIPHSLIPTVASILGYIISIFISHSGDLAAGIFMGFFYGNAAIGTYAGLKTAFRAYRQKDDYTYKS